MTQNKLFLLSTFALLLMVLYSRLILAENKFQSFKPDVFQVLESDDDLSFDEQREVEENLITLIELSVEFYKVALELDNQVDNMLNKLNNEADTFDQTIDKYMELNEVIRGHVLTIQSDLKNDTLFRFSTIDSFSLKLAPAWNQLKTSTGELMLQFAEIKKKNAKDLASVEIMLETIKESGGIINKLITHMKKSGFVLKINREPEIDEATLTIVGPTVLKLGTLFLFYCKEMKRIDDKLESLGYFNTTLSADKDVLRSIDEELKLLSNIKESALNIFKEANGILGINNLWSYAMATRRMFVEIKLPRLYDLVTVRTRVSFRRAEEAIQTTGKIANDVHQINEILEKRLHLELYHFLSSCLQ